MRWKAHTKCIREGCDGDIEFWLEELIEFPALKPLYRFACTECDLQGPWETFARQRKYRHGGTRVFGWGEGTGTSADYSPEDF